MTVEVTCLAQKDRLKFNLFGEGSIILGVSMGKSSQFIE